MPALRLSDELAHGPIEHTHKQYSHRESPCINCSWQCAKSAGFGYISSRINLTGALPYDRKRLLNFLTEKSLPNRALCSSRSAVISA